LPQASIDEDVLWPDISGGPGGPRSAAPLPRRVDSADSLAIMYCFAQTQAKTMRTSRSRTREHTNLLTATPDEAALAIACALSTAGRLPVLDIVVPGAGCPTARDGRAGSESVGQTGKQSAVACDLAIFLWRIACDF